MTLHHKNPELTLDQCLKCNICTVSCPVARVTTAFPGPKYAGPQSARFRSHLAESSDRSVDYCSGCRICNMVCPAGVKIAEMNARARSHWVSEGNQSLRNRLRNNLIARAENLGKIAQPVSPLANYLLKNPSMRKFGETILGISQHAPLPEFAPYQFTTWFKNRRMSQEFVHKVVYFHGCSTRYYEPWVGIAAVQVLEKNGLEVIVPEQNCCGLPLLSNGEFNAARKLHQANVEKLSGYVKQGYKIVGTSTSCTLTLKEEAPELLGMHDKDTSLVAANIFDFNQFLLELYDQGDLNLDFRAINKKIPYHVPCQYRAHRIGTPGIDILSLIPGLSIVESHADCCGIAGTYGYKEEKYQIAMDVGEPLFDFIRGEDSNIVLCDSETCRWQIQHATGRIPIHPVELMAYAYGFEPQKNHKVYKELSGDD